MLGNAMTKLDDQASRLTCCRGGTGGGR
jgi:hypothetical protein